MMMMLIVVVEVDFEISGRGSLCYDIVHQYDKNELRPRECHFIPIPILKELDICIWSADTKISDINRLKDGSNHPDKPVMTFDLESWPQRYSRNKMEGTFEDEFGRAPARVENVSLKCYI